MPLSAALKNAVLCVFPMKFNTSKAVPYAALEVFFNETPNSRAVGNQPLPYCCLIPFSIKISIPERHK